MENNRTDGHGTNGTTLATPEKPSPAGAARSSHNRSSARQSEIVLAPNYRPSDAEPFMSEQHRHYFRQKLIKWKEDIVRQNMETLKGLHDESPQQADPADRRAT